MSSFKQTLTKYSSALQTEKQQFKTSIEKVSYFRDFSNDLTRLIKFFWQSYKTYGERHLTEFESLENYRKTINPRITLLKILSSVSSNSKIIGDFYISQSEAQIETLQNKNREFLFQIENFNLSSKTKTIKIIEETGKILSEMIDLSQKIEECTRQREEIKGIVLGLEGNMVKADQKLENLYKDAEKEKEKEMQTLEEKKIKLEATIDQKFMSLKQNFEEILQKSTEIESKCTENIEKSVTDLSKLLVHLLEFRKNSSEKLNSTLETISIHDSDKNSSESFFSESETLELSSQKIEILSKISKSFSIISECEKNILQPLSNLSKSSMVFKQDTDLSLYTARCLEDVQESVKIQLKLAQDIQVSVIKPIETLIRVQTSINSSLQVSIKNISKNFLKASEHYLSSPRRHSAFQAKNENLPNKMQKFKENQSRQISSLLNDHLSKENSYLSNVKHTLTLMHEKNVKVYEEVNDLLTNVNLSFKSMSLVGDSGLDLSVIEDSVSVLKKTSRNDFRVLEEHELSSDNDEYNRRLDRRNTECVVASFLCAYLNGILLQGKMYITPSFVGFFSYFNPDTIIGRETALRIPIAEIKLISKEKTAFIFDNSINVVTQDSSYFFSSFISRDEAFQILTKLINLHDKRVMRIQRPVHLLIETRKSRLDISKKLKEESDPFTKMLPDSYLAFEIFEPIIEIDAPLTKVYQMLYADSSDFYKVYLETTGDVVEELTPWSCLPPDYFLGKEGSSWPASATRTAKSRHKLKERLPLMPTHCLIIEQQTIYFVNQEKFVIEGEFEINAPYGEYFSTYIRWTLEGKEKTKVRVRYGMVFNSYTIFQGKIIREGRKETTQTLNTIWKPLAIQRLSGCEQPLPVLEVPKPQPPKLKTQWELWGVICVLLLIILKLFLKVRSLEADLGLLQRTN